MQESVDVVLRITAEPKGAIGYGSVYRCGVQQVLKGSLNPKEILMTILVSDRQNDEFFSSHQSPAVVEAGFKKDKENVPYQMMPISGFVDEHMISWHLVYTR